MRRYEVLASVWRGIAVLVLAGCVLYGASLNGPGIEAGIGLGILLGLLVWTLAEFTDGFGVIVFYFAAAAKRQVKK